MLLVVYYIRKFANESSFIILLRRDAVQKTELKIEDSFFCNFSCSFTLLRIRIIVFSETFDTGYEMAITQNETKQAIGIR